MIVKQCRMIYRSLEKRLVAKVPSLRNSVECSLYRALESIYTNIKCMKLPEEREEGVLGGRSVIFHQKVENRLKAA